MNKLETQLETTSHLYKQKLVGAGERDIQDIAVFYLLLMKHVLIKRAVISCAVLGYVNRC